MAPYDQRTKTALQQLLLESPDDVKDTIIDKVKIAVDLQSSRGSCGAQAKKKLQTTMTIRKQLLPAEDQALALWPKPTLRT